MNEYLNSTAYLVFALVAYVVMAAPLYVMGQKTNCKNPWFAFIPILNALLLVEIAGKEWWWVLLLFVPCINLFVAIYLWMEVASAMNKPSWIGVLMIVPVLNFVIPYYLAFG